MDQQLNSIPPYPRVWNLGHPAVNNLFDGPVLVQEKVDGSQLSFGRFCQDKHLVIRSKGEVIYDDSQGGILSVSGQKMFSLAVQSVLSRADRLQPYWVYRGEFLSKPKHNTLAYDRVPDGNIVLFDIELRNQQFAAYNSVRTEAEFLGLEVVPQIGPADGWTNELMHQFLETDSFLAGQKVEGLVFKNYELFGRDGKVLMGKFVSERFKEVHSAGWKGRNPGQGDIVSQLGQALRTPARWDKAIQHLRERGELENSPQDISRLLVELKADLLEEEKENVTRKLLDWAMPKILRMSAAGFAEYYKELLAMQQFGGDR